MKIVVDTNIVFSAVLNTNSKIGRILTEGSVIFDFYSIHQLNEEIITHNNKIISLTKYSDEHLYETLELLTENFTFIEIEKLSDNSVKRAYDLVQNVDINDLLFVALAIELDSKLWTGDKKLVNGLKIKILILLYLHRNYINYSLIMRVRYFTRIKSLE